MEHAEHQLNENLITNDETKLSNCNCLTYPKTDCEDCTLCVDEDDQIMMKTAKNMYEQKMLMKAVAEVNNVDSIEQRIANTYITQELVNKEYGRLLTSTLGVWNAQMIPRFLSTVYHRFISESTWSFIKKFKSPKVNFEILQEMVNQKVKQFRPELFK